MNPAMDKTAQVDTFRAGGLNRLFGLTQDAGGKGVNVSKMIASLGGRSIATGFLGGAAGQEIAARLQALGVETDFVETCQPTRTNLKIVSGDGVVTECNEPGALVQPEEEAALSQKLADYAKPGVTFVLAGSLPQGVGQDAYKKLTLALKARGASVCLDADGEVFRQALEAKPDFIKPNRFELMQYFGLDTPPEIEVCKSLCGRLIRQGIGFVALSLGPEGALFVTAGESLYAPGLSVPVRSTVGAGDSMAAALVYGFEAGMGLREAASLAVAASAGAVMTEGTSPPDRQTVDMLLERVGFA